MDVVDLNKFRTKKAQDVAVATSSEMLVELNYYLNDMANRMNPELLAGAVATQLGRFIQGLDPNLETDLLEKCLLVMEIFARGYKGEEE